MYKTSQRYDSLDDKGIPLTYSFRIRFNRSPTDTIQLDASTLAAPVVDERLTIALRARQDDLPIRDSDQLALIGSGYESADEADAAGRQFQNALLVALARVRVGADFGHRAAKGMFTEHGLKWVEEQIGQRALNNVHGLMVFQSNPKPRFAATNAQMTRGASPEVFMTAFTQAIALQPQITDRDLLAYTLFNASFFQPTSDSRFLLLVMAVEALLEPALRSADAQEHVSSLIEQTKSSSLSLDEKNSIHGALRWLRRESINQAGKRLAAERLGFRVYGDRAATDFFSYCYQLRSNFVHGSLPVPTFEEIGSAAAPLEVLVADLLTGPILGYPLQ